MPQQHKLEEFIRKMEEFIDARIDQKFREYLDAFKFDALRAQLSNETLPHAATTFLQAIVEGHIPASIAERARLCQYTLDKIKIEDISYETQTIISRVQRLLEASNEQNSQNNDEAEPLDNSMLEFLTLKASNLYSLELVALAYTHRDFAQLLESGYEQMRETPMVDLRTGEYDKLLQAKLDYVRALLEGKIAYTHLETSKQFTANNEIEINDAGEIRSVGRSARSEQ